MLDGASLSLPVVDTRHMSRPARITQTRNTQLAAAHPL